MKNKRVKNKKNAALLHKLKLIVLICVVILICEVGFISYLLFFKDKESIYFDGINAVVSSENYYASVGSNNDNDNFYEKAKISKYDKSIIDNSEDNLLNSVISSINLNLLFFA